MSKDYFIFNFGWVLGLRYSDPEDRIFNSVISDIFVEQRETTLTILNSIETGSPVDWGGEGAVSYRDRIFLYPNRGTVWLTSRIRNSESSFPLYNGNNRDNTFNPSQTSSGFYLSSVQVF